MIAEPAIDAEARMRGAVRVSALEGEGLDTLVNKMAEVLFEEAVVGEREVWTAPSYVEHPSTAERLAKLLDGHELV